jgi:hypothetical protein
MLVYITDYNGYMSGPEAGLYVHNHVGVSDDCKNLKKTCEVRSNMSHSKIVMVR